MSFSQEIKKEILSKDFCAEGAKYFIFGLLTSAGYRNGSSFVIKFNKPEITEMVLSLLRKTEISFEKSAKNKNWIIIKNFSPNQEIKNPGNFFGGVFLGGGSISKLESSSYHLELQFTSHINAERVKSFLNNYSFNFVLIQRRKNHVIYLKKSEEISDFLKAIQAYKSLMTYEDERIKRDFKNQLNRYSNLDVYNQKKLAKSSIQFKKKFLFIKEKNLEKKFSSQELVFFELKMNLPFSSLSELSNSFYEKTGIKKTRSGLNHYLIKLRKVYEENSY